MPTPALESKRRKNAVLLLLAWCLVMLALLPRALHAQPEPTPTPQPFAVRSIFANDTCAPPCWFGLTPGVSTAEDAALLLEAHPEWFIGPDWRGLRPETSGRVNRETGYVIDGNYNFNLAIEWQRPATGYEGYSRIIIEDNYVDRLRIVVREYVTLAQALDALGNPDIVRFTSPESDHMRLTLIYSDLRLRILLISIDKEDNCSLANLGQDFWADELYYYSPHAAEEPAMLPFIDAQQPALFAYETYDRDVSLDIWESWISGEVGLSCEEAYMQLPKKLFYRL
ncbi:MAG: hypothetical protein U0694_13330 [Anaerolineae bacterium]